MGFAVSEVVGFRQVRFGLCWLEVPVRVLRDDDEWLVTYLAEGTPFSSSAAEFPWGPHPWLPLGVWQGHGIVMQQRPGEAHAVWAFWAGPERAFAHWYVNFQEPFRRTAAGIETFDQELDLIVEPDGRYRWKDVEEFEQMIADGRWTTAEGDGIRAEAGRVAGRLDRGERWWDESWAGWVPPPEWSAPPEWAPPAG